MQKRQNNPYERHADRIRRDEAELFDFCAGREDTGFCYTAESGDEECQLSSGSDRLHQLRPHLFMHELSFPTLVLYNSQLVGHVAFDTCD